MKRGDLVLVPPFVFLLTWGGVFNKETDKYFFCDPILLTGQISLQSRFVGCCSISLQSHLLTAAQYIFNLILSTAQ